MVMSMVQRFHTRWKIAGVEESVRRHAEVVGSCLVELVHNCLVELVHNCLVESMDNHCWLVAEVVDSYCNIVEGVDNLDSQVRDSGCMDMCDSCYVYQAVLGSSFLVHSIAFLTSYT